jgi:hypothetical protein
MRGHTVLRYGLSLAAQGVRRWRFSPPYLPAGVFSPREEETPTYRFKLPKIPRTSARPTWVATVRATLFIAASTTVSR